MKITRDSALLYVGALLGVLGYLMASDHTPVQWTYHEWLQAASVALVWIMGKLGTSPLAGDGDNP